MKPPFKLGLTGSIGMGKSTTAAMFRDCGLPVWDADAAVHRLYALGGAAVAPLSRLVPTATLDGCVSREVLRMLIAQDANVLTRVELVVHPLVAKDRDQFIAKAKGDLIILDIPLLFETGLDATLDATLLVTAPAAVQRARVLARAGMTLDQFELIMARQMPDPEKRRRATHIVETLDLRSTQAYVQALITYIRASHA